MVRMVILRALAQLIDLFAAFAVLLVCLLVGMPALEKLLGNPTAAAIIALVLSLAGNLLVQLPFYRVGQTIGKGLASLQVVSTNEERPLTPMILIYREWLCKIMSCFFICIPVLAGHKGGHEVATETKVVYKPRAPLFAHRSGRAG